MKTNAPKATWQTDWPNNGDLKAWLDAMIQKCDAIADDSVAAKAAHLPISEIARNGSAAEALGHVDRFLRRLPPEKVGETVRLAQLGAEICLQADDLGLMEKYLAVAAATEPFITRKCDKGFSLNSVRRFRAQNGLLDPADAIDEEQRTRAMFERADRQCRNAIVAGEGPPAKSSLAEMEKIAAGIEVNWKRQAFLKRIVERYAELKDADAVMRCLNGFNVRDRDKVLDAGMLMNLGMKVEAVARARRDILQKLEELRTTKDPNIHFPAMAVGHLLEFLVEHGEKEEARRWLHRALDEMPTWPVIQLGWMTTSVYNSFASAVALIDGPAAAETLIKNAMNDAQREKHRDFRKGATRTALDLKGSIGNLDEAIAAAGKLRSPTERRKNLARLLARAQRWEELREVLSQTASPEEAAEVAWWLKFELPGGEAR